MAKRTQPEWAAPVSFDRPELKLFNSLTRQKEVFVPQKGKTVTWYNCGPTVYDHSHMGHARTYLSFDILRRVLQDYFGYDVFYVMNITDIDDKIIKRARQNHLYKGYLASNHSLEKILEDCDIVMKHFGEVVQKTEDKDKKAMQEKLFEKMKAAVANMEKAVKSGDKSILEEKKSELLSDSKDLFSDWLDKCHGSSVTENSIFSQLPKYWEEEYHKDMEALNVLPADCLTRVSEYVPEIVTYIETIIERGYAYHSNGSVYFDVGKFDGSPCHHYAKLVPEAVGDVKALAEGEGDLSTGEEKRAPNDFALWKCSKPGEPSWESPWGQGRPGWHIECSAMASAILGQSIDIHTGGVDLKFPHHDNELAQSEAYFDNDCWTRYFLHSGHLTIAGCKMSKSLKNFITIQEVLQKYSARQLRLMFLLHSWKDTMDYSENTMELAKGFERTVNEFFLGVKHLMRTTPGTGVDAFSKWGKLEVELNSKFLVFQSNIHAALCDNIDTRSSLDNVRELVSVANIYMDSCKDQKSIINRQLLVTISSYITNLFDIFGLVSKGGKSVGFPVSSGEGEVDMETLVMPYLDVLAEFRDVVRVEARKIKAVSILSECDRIRDDSLPNLGVRLEDKEDARAVIKMVDKDTLMKERAEKQAVEEKKRQEKEKKKAEAAAKAAAADAVNSIPPPEMFRRQTDKFSEWDEEGFPTLDIKGEEISKGQIKKLQKLYQAQVKKYNEYVRVQEEKKSKNKGGDFKNDTRKESVVQEAPKPVVEDAAQTVTEEIANLSVSEDATKTEQ